MTDPAMKAKQAKIQQQRAWKFGEKSKAARAEKEATKKAAKQLHRGAIVALPEITDDFPSLLESTAVD